MRSHSVFFRGAIAAVAAAAPLLFAAPAAAEETEEGAEKFSEVQKLGYLGRTSKSALTRSVLARMKNRLHAPEMTSAMERVKFWHEVTLNAVALDHTPDPDSGDVPFVQGGPGRTSRALAMTMIAVYDAANAFDDKYVPYNEIKSPRGWASMDAAIAVAAHDVLVRLYPYQRAQLNSLLISDLRQISASRRSIRTGVKVGREAALAILKERRRDRSYDAEPSFGGGGRVADGETTYFGTPVNGGTALIGEWEPDPNTPEFSGDFNLSLGAYWGGVEPFALKRGDQFRIPPPPAPGTAKYIEAYNEVAALGGSPDNTGIASTSTEETRFIGNFWGYDAVPLLGTPPRAYNQIAINIAMQEGVRDPVDLARLLAKVNVALGDSGIAAWDSKWFYNYWRPVTGIRRDDGVAETTTDAAWDPVGVSILNVELPPDTGFIRPTPPFPAYPSGHATFCASLFEILRDEFGDDTPFTHVSDEYNGEGVDPFNGAPRPLVPVFYNTLTEAQLENGVSRIYNGVHWQYDNIEGQNLGENIARWILTETDAFQPRKKRWSDDWAYGWPNDWPNDWRRWLGGAN